MPVSMKRGPSGPVVHGRHHQQTLVGEGSFVDKLLVIHDRRL
jgi:hypothetical protein